MRIRDDEHGQSMVGMLAVLVIVGLVFWFTFGGGENGGGMNPQETVERGKEAQVQSELRTLEQSIQLYRSKNGSYPPDLRTLVDNNSVPASAIKGPEGERYEYNPETGKVSQ